MPGTAQSETIAAVATPPGRGGIGVVRISGPRCREIARQLLGGLPAPREARFCVFRNPAGDVIDRGIALHFPAPASYTGEDVLELQGHGGDIVMQILLQAALDAGARQARPGEFTERAFINDKIDLLQAEATADLIESASATAARCALRSLQGDFSGRVHELQGALTELRVRVEGALDFPDEDVETVIGVDLIEVIRAQLASVDNIQSQAKKGALLRTGIEVVITGRPNVGKSSLINRLVEREAAIVTDIPGTTRDPIRETCLIDGLQVMLTDTAGLRESEDPIEQEGVRRTNNAIMNADVVLWMHDEQLPPSADREQVRAQLPAGAVLIEVQNKIDKLDLEPYRHTGNKTDVVIGLSALSGAGLDLLRETIKQHVGFSPAGEHTFMARERHLRALQDVHAQLTVSLKAVESGEPLELIAESLRQAQQSLGELTGEFSADDLLGEIFSRFCIGK